MAVSPKIIYLEADEEVTSVIDKIRKTEFKDVVLILPKGASLSQSVINLKLIKKKAEELGKAVSIVTQDKIARNLAEKVGLVAAVSADRIAEAQAAASRAEVPADKEIVNSPLEPTDEVIFDHKTVEGMEPGELKVFEGEDVESAVETKEDILENLDSNQLGEKRNLMPHIPYAKVGIAAGAVLLILLSLGFVYLPRARAILSLNSESKAVTINISGDKDAKLDLEKAVIPTKIVEAEKESSKKYPATGKKDVGTKASGKVRIYYNAVSGDKSWAAGTRLYPKNKSSLVYRITDAVTFKAGEPSVVSVQADLPGDGYNGFLGDEFVATNDPDTKITLTCTEVFTGGLTKEVSVVTDGDINSAKDNLSKEAENDATAEFNKKYGDVKVVDSSKKTEITSVKADPAANTEASEFNLTIKVTIKAVAFSVEDVSNLVKADVERQLGFNKEIIDSGASSADVAVDSADLETGKLTATVKAKAYVSAKVDQDKLKDELTGLNAAKAENYLKGIEGVSAVKLEFWPTFIKLFPRVKNHIYVVTQVADSAR